MKKTVLSLVVLTSLFGCSNDPQDALQSKFQDGLEEIDENDFDRASQTFTELGVEFPTSHLGQYGRGLILERQLLYYDAIHDYVVLLQTNPSFAPANQAVGRAFTRVGDFAEAAKAYTSYASLEPANPVAQFESARAHFANHSHQQAEVSIDRAGQAGIKKTLGDIFKARLSFAQNRLEAATSLIDGALPSLESDPLSYREMADYYEDRHMADSSMHYSRLSAKYADVDKDLLLDDFYRALRLDYHYFARKSLEKFRKFENPESFIAGLEIAYYIDVEDGSKAPKMSGDWSARHPKKVTPVLLDIHSRWLIKDSWSVSQDRSSLLDKLSDQGYAAPYILFLLGRMTIAFAKYTEVGADILDIRQSSGWKLGQREHLLQELYLLSVTGQGDTVDAKAAKLEHLHSDRPEWMTGLGDIYSFWRVRDYDKASEFYSRALNISPMNITAFEHWIDMEMDLDKWQAALDLMGKYPNILEYVPTTAMRKIRCMIELNEWSEALSLFRRTLPELRGDIKQFAELVKLIRLKNHDDDANELVDYFADLGNDNPDAQNFAASYFANLNDEVKALRFANQGLKFEKDHVGLQVQIARVYLMQDQREKGIALFEELYDSEPGNSELLMHYAHALAGDKSMHRKAANLARSAIFYDQASVDVRLNLCKVYWKMERYDLVKGEARGALGLEKENPEVLFWLGRAFAKLEDSEAKEAFTRAIKFGLAGAELEEAKATLKAMN